MTRTELRRPDGVSGCMKMATWRHLIRATSDRIADSERRIERQRQLIADLARDGDDTALAERELAALMEGHEQLQLSKTGLLEGFQKHCNPDVVATLPHHQAG